MLPVVLVVVVVVVVVVIIIVVVIVKSIFPLLLLLVARETIKAIYLLNYSITIYIVERYLYLLVK